MLFAGIMIDSLMIDRLKKKWAARCLFLLVFAISVCSNIWPLGDSDLSGLTTWLDKYNSNPASLLSADTIVLPVITMGNILYFLFSLAVVVVYIFIAFLYSRIYVGEKSEQSLESSVLSYFKRLPVLIVFFMIIAVPALFLYGINPIVLLCCMPALFFSPILIMLEKQNPIDAIADSYKYTKGAKLSIFWNLLTLYFMYQAAIMLFLSLMPSDSSASTLPGSFFTAYFVLAAGRLCGVFYDRLRIHPVPPAAGPLV